MFNGFASFTTVLQHLLLALKIKSKSSSNLMWKNWFRMNVVCYLFVSEKCETFRTDDLPESVNLVQMCVNRIIHRRWKISYLNNFTSYCFINLKNINKTRLTWTVPVLRDTISYWLKYKLGELYLSYRSPILVLLDVSWLKVKLKLTVFILVNNSVFF